MWEWSSSSGCSRHLPPGSAMASTGKADPGVGHRCRVRGCMRTRHCGPRRQPGGERKSHRQHQWSGRKPRGSKCFSRRRQREGGEAYPGDTQPVHTQAGSLPRSRKGPGAGAGPTPEPTASASGFPRAGGWSFSSASRRRGGGPSSESSAQHPRGGQPCSQDTGGDLELGTRNPEGLSGAGEEVRPQVMAPMLRGRQGPPPGLRAKTVL